MVGILGEGKYISVVDFFMLGLIFDKYGKLLDFGINFDISVDYLCVF